MPLDQNWLTAQTANQAPNLNPAYLSKLAALGTPQPLGMPAMGAPQQGGMPRFLSLSSMLGGAQPTQGAPAQGAPATGAPVQGQAQTPQAQRFMPLGQSLGGVQGNASALWPALSDLQAMQTQLASLPGAGPNISGIGNLLRAGYGIGTGSYGAAPTSGFPTSGLGQLGAGVGALSNIGSMASGSPGGIAGGALGLGSKLASWGGFPVAGAALGALTGPLGIGTGLASGNYGNLPNDVVSTIAGLGSLASAAAPLGAVTGGELAALAGAGTGLVAGGGTSALAGLGATLGGAASALALPAAGISIGLMNMMKKDAKKVKQQTQESGDIRRGLAEAWPNVLAGLETARGLGAINDLPAEQQVAALQDAKAKLETALQDLSVDFSRFSSTKGVGGKASLLKAVDTSAADALAAEAYPDVITGLARVQDALAARGIAPADIVKPMEKFDLGDLLNWSRPFTTTPAAVGQQYAMGTTPQDFAGQGPGGVEAFLRNWYSQHDPGFSTSTLGQRMTALPTVTTPQGFNPAAGMQQFSDARLARSRQELMPLGQLAAPNAWIPGSNYQLLPAPATYLLGQADRQALMDAIQAGKTWDYTPRGELDPQYGRPDSTGLFREVFSRYGVALPEVAAPRLDYYSDPSSGWTGG